MQGRTTNIRNPEDRLSESEWNRNQDKIQHSPSIVKVAIQQPWFNSEYWAVLRGDIKNNPEVAMCAIEQIWFTDQHWQDFDIIIKSDPAMQQLAIERRIIPDTYHPLIELFGDPNTHLPTEPKSTSTPTQQTPAPATPGNGGAGDQKLSTIEEERESEVSGSSFDPDNLLEQGGRIGMGDLARPQHKGGIASFFAGLCRVGTAYQALGE